MPKDFDVTFMVMVRRGDGTTCITATNLGGLSELLSTILIREKVPLRNLVIEATRASWTPDPVQQEQITLRRMP